MEALFDKRNEGLQRRMRNILHQEIYTQLGKLYLPLHKQKNDFQSLHIEIHERIKRALQCMRPQSCGGMWMIDIHSLTSVSYF